MLDVQICTNLKVTTFGLPISHLKRSEKSSETQKRKSKGIKVLSLNSLSFNNLKNKIFFFF